VTFTENAYDVAETEQMLLARSPGVERGFKNIDLDDDVRD